MPPENTNSVLVSSGGDCVIFDPWGRADDWEKLLTAKAVTPRAIYATHGHPDHISAAADLAKKYNIKWFLNRDDRYLIGWGNELLNYFGLPPVGRDAVIPDDLPAGCYDILPGVHMHAIASPGHTPGGMIFLFPEHKIMLTGDTLFRDTVGRYDFPGGDRAALTRSVAGIRELGLPDDTYVVHGHGTDSTIGILKSQNPYFS